MSAEIVGKVDLSDKRGMERWRKARGGEKSATSSKPEPERVDPKALPPLPPLDVMVGRANGPWAMVGFQWWVFSR